MPQSKSAPKQTNNLASFRAVHDRTVWVPVRIRKALADMARESAENWEYEHAFMKRAQISPTDLGSFRDAFSEHIVMTSGKNPKRVWFASPKIAAQVRG